MVFIMGLVVFTPGLLYILSQWENDGAWGVKLARVSAVL